MAAPIWLFYQWLSKRKSVFILLSVLGSYQDVIILADPNVSLQIFQALTWVAGMTVEQEPCRNLKRDTSTNQQRANT